MAVTSKRFTSKSKLPAARIELHVNREDNILNTQLRETLSEDWSAKLKKAFEIIKQGADPNACNVRAGVSILHVAIEQSEIDEESLNLLKSAGFNINTEDKNGETALHWAVRFGDLENTKLLLDNGADINIRDKSGRTPLFQALLCRNVNAVKMLLLKGADPNVPDIYGETPLHYIMQNIGSGAF